eukprot:maker-scaffold208_size258758-snap-gene-1.32 protein:Tk04208 transcript:maker-scaffold208_size258758-snap-gene-1.32-mRNA-1 annotation:"sparc-related modular calcium-binding protein 1-like"
MEHRHLGWTISVMVLAILDTSLALSIDDREPTTDPSGGVPRCSLDCSHQSPDPVCGTNGRTYSNRCSLDQATICQGIKNVRFHYKGSCSQDDHRCIDERQQALKTSNESGIPIFVPVCHLDGSYVEVQCHYGTGYCWCVNNDGKPIPRTSIRYDRPNCKRERRRRNRRGKGKKKKNRRNRGRKNKSGSTSRDGDSNSSSEESLKRKCTQSDRKEFNQIILDALSEEHRQLHSRPLEAQGLIGDQKKEIIEWKFDAMDANG